VPQKTYPGRMVNIFARDDRRLRTLVFFLAGC